MSGCPACPPSCSPPPAAAEAGASYTMSYEMTFMVPDASSSCAHPADLRREPRAPPHPPSPIPSVVVVLVLVLARQGCRLDRQHWWGRGSPAGAPALVPLAALPLSTKTCTGCPTARAALPQVVRRHQQRRVRVARLATHASRPRRRGGGEEEEGGGGGGRGEAARSRRRSRLRGSDSRDPRRRRPKRAAGCCSAFGSFPDSCRLEVARRRKSLT